MSDGLLGPHAQRDNQFGSGANRRVRMRRQRHQLGGRPVLGEFYEIAQLS
ncbi:MAG: hypothetical protein WKF82_02765 [Nocardioidaceae bacterium]